MEFFKVIVVGGGAAGLAAAHALAEKVDFVLLEGNDYLGGRIRTVDAGLTRNPNLFIFSCSTFDLSLDESSTVDLVKKTSNRKVWRKKSFFRSGRSVYSWREKQSRLFDLLDSRLRFTRKKSKSVEIRCFCPSIERRREKTICFRNSCRDQR